MTESALFYRKHVFCCTNKRAEGDPRGCCMGKGAGAVRNYLKDRCKELGLEDIRINAAGCLDRCALGPCLVVYPDSVWYSCASIGDAEEIVRRHLMGERRWNDCGCPFRAPLRSKPESPLSANVA